jgi:hypothetical protein
MVGTAKQIIKSDKLALSAEERPPPVMQSKYDPFDLKISVSPHGGIDEWQWTLSIGNGAPIETGVVKGSRMDGIRAAPEERLRLIGKAVEATRKTHLA